LVEAPPVYPRVVAGRASIVGAAETSVGKVRDHNEDAHFIDPEAGIFIVCDGMGGHAAGEVASALAVKTIRSQWSGNTMEAVTDRWLIRGTPEARKQLLGAVTQGVLAAHEAIVSVAASDRGKKGVGTTVVAAIIVGGDGVFALCGDARA
jgi:serine/threonine protein phosphatase PrpC